MQTGNRKHQLTAREMALQVLLAVEQQAAYSNLALQAALARHPLPANEKALATEIVYGTVQRLNTIDYRLLPFLKQPLTKLDDWVRNLLRLSVYQLDYLERVPPFAVIHEAVEIAKRKNPRLSGFVNAVLRNLLRAGQPDFPPFEQDPVRHLSLVHSHPEWLVREWIGQYGAEETARICQANNQRPALSLRVNRLRATREEVLAALAKEGLAARLSAVSPDGIVLATGTDVTKLPPFQEGLCTVQDESSMLVALCVDPQPGMRILDACAAPGGKTTHLAERMEDRGEIVAADIHEHKIGLIRNATARLGLRSVQPIAGDVRELAGSLGQFDAVLLDAPCSGFGVIRRKPDIKWRKTQQDAIAIRGVQTDLIRKLADSVKPGGILVYSTCTIERQENQEIIRNFLRERTDFQIAPLSPLLPEDVAKTAVSPDGWAQVLPHHFGTDGFFICRMRKLMDNRG
ncbi:16S rRNA (cytosine(967)-C(5))-methyltransferase RsmB [Effusibacillus pohliae]|uniref:16S rRNA (cytosine(967)-C(5))-methyltransferase RsmB n=1 Tax=Effusibacillus pohliae TaxID=232270 RepID=UPI00047810B9|nr:16S rRNA (cytosine(967)-C(5))-methyltransferase RsmB [Effusibacillus pohliae]